MAHHLRKFGSNVVQFLFTFLLLIVAYTLCLQMIEFPVNLSHHPAFIRRLHSDHDNLLFTHMKSSINSMTSVFFHSDFMNKHSEIFFDTIFYASSFIRTSNFFLNGIYDAFLGYHEIVQFYCIRIRTFFLSKILSLFEILF